MSDEVLDLGEDAVLEDDFVQEGPGLFDEPGSEPVAPEPAEVVAKPARRAAKSRAKPASDQPSDTPEAEPTTESPEVVPEKLAAKRRRAPAKAKVAEAVTELSDEVPEIPTDVFEVPTELSEVPEPVTEDGSKVDSATSLRSAQNDGGSVPAIPAEVAVPAEEKATVPAEVPAATTEVPESATKIAEESVPAIPVAGERLAEAPLALYRRYRPDVFADIIGQEHVTEPLRRALNNNRVNHAYLFSGPRGCGKTSSARILARALNCQQGPTPDPCGQCQSCRDLARGGPGSIDVIEIDAASHGGVDDARDLRERAFFAPVHSRYKVYIVDEAHMVTPQGFNALLKLVEEPPPHVKFVFATTEPEKVIGTIRSRTHHYPFRLVPPRILTDFLTKICAQEHVTADPGVLGLVVRAGAGSVRDSLSILDQLLGGAAGRQVSYAQASALLGYTPDTLLDEFVDALSAGDAAGVFATVDKVIEAGQEPRRFAEDLLQRLRDLIIVGAADSVQITGLLELPEDQAERYRLQAQGLGAGELTRAAEVLAAGLVGMRGTTAPRLQLELMCARMLLPGADVAGRGIHARLDRLERRLGMSCAEAASPAPASVPGPARTSDPAWTTEPVRTADSAWTTEPVRTADSAWTTAPAEAHVPGRVSEPPVPGLRAGAGQSTAEASARPGSSPGTAASSAGTDSPYTPESTVADGGARPASSAGTASSAGAAGPSVPELAAVSGRPGLEAGDGEWASGEGSFASIPSVIPEVSRGETRVPASWPGEFAAAEEQGTEAVIPPDLGGIDVTELRRHWPRILEELSRRNKSAWMNVRQFAQVSEVIAQVLWLTYAAPGPRQWFTERGQEVLRQVIVDQLGTNFTIRARLETDPPPRAEGVLTGLPSASPLPPNRQSTVAPTPWTASRDNPPAGETPPLRVMSPVENDPVAAPDDRAQPVVSPNVISQSAISPDAEPPAGAGYEEAESNAESSATQDSQSTGSLDAGLSMESPSPAVEPGRTITTLTAGDNTGEAWGEPQPATSSIASSPTPVESAAEPVTHKPPAAPARKPPAKRTTSRTPATPLDDDPEAYDISPDDAIVPPELFGQQAAELVSELLGAELVKSEERQPG